MKNKLSLFVVFLVFLSLCFTTLAYYPKWKNTGTEAVISWDVAGYYQYLPAAFIYQDLKKCAFLEGAIKTYGFVPHADQLTVLPNGNRVMKYAVGQAVMFSPFFALGHIWAKYSDYPADGYSIPYQIAMELEILFFAFVGLWFLRLILLRYFSDKIVATAVLSIGLATNYFEYASMTGAMTHNNLFAVYALLIYSTIRFYEKPRVSWAIGIGILLGLAALTRPTEMIAVIIPLLWGVQYPWRSGVRLRVDQIKKYFSYYALMACFAVAIGSVQLMYWKYVTGDWFYYSYGNEGFDWLHPHIEDCLISMKAGWLVYSPIMLFSLIGFYFLFKRYRSIFPATLLVSVLAMYIVFSWQTWWYGGSLGQRALIQYYPVLAFPLAACIDRMLANKWSKIFFGGLMALFIYYNLWLSHQVHKGGLVYVSQMRRAYFWKVVGRFHKNIDDLKLLDTDEYFNGTQKNKKILYSDDFESGDESLCHPPPIQGVRSPCMSSLDPVSPEYGVAFRPGESKWIRVSVDFFCEYSVQDPKSMGWLKVRFYHDKRLVKEKQIRIHRVLSGGTARTIFLDVKCPRKEFNRLGVQMSHGAAGNMLLYDMMRIEAFD